MRATTPLLVAALCGLALTAFSRPLPQDDEHDETPLAEAMNRVGDALGDLRRSVRDPEATEASLASVLICQEASLFSKTQTPAMAAGVPEGERPAFVKAYRLEMIRFERALLDLEQALLEGKDVESLRELYKGLKGMEDPAHERFTEDG
jgi:hypothetical protein